MKLLKVLGSVLILISLVMFFRYQMRNYQHILLEKSLNEEVTSLKIGTYNIKTLNQGTSLEEAIADLEEAQLDIICLQEVDEKSWRSKNMDMTQEIADGLDMPYHYFFPSMFLGKGYYGLAIISRYPILEVQSENLNVSLLREPRILAKAKIDVGSRPLDIYMTHLSFRPLEDKYQQMSFLQERFKDSERTILIGDFNIFKDDDFFEISGMKHCNRVDDKYITFMDFGFNDNIFYSDDLLIDDLDVQKTSFSDHNLFYGTLHLD